MGLGNLGMNLGQALGGLLNGGIRQDGQSGNDHQVNTGGGIGWNKDDGFYIDTNWGHRSSWGEGAPSIGDVASAYQQMATPHLYSQAMDPYGIYNASQYLNPYYAYMNSLFQPGISQGWPSGCSTGYYPPVGGLSTGTQSVNTNVNTNVNDNSSSNSYAGGGLIVNNNENNINNSANSG